ncbi:MAG: disulfide bond formation protein B [Paracoccaceae bacterium]
MSVYGRILLAGFGSLALLLGAFAFQYLGELAPCPMCLWQRWPHAVAILLAIAVVTVLWRFRRPLSALAALIVSVGAGIGLYHAGVEQKWWEGPSSCSSLDPNGLSTDELLAQIQGAPLVTCDQVVWDLFGITMAGWNAVISLGLALLWLFAALPRTTTRHIVPDRT